MRATSGWNRGRSCPVKYLKALLVYQFKVLAAPYIFLKKVTKVTHIGDLKLQHNVTFLLCHQSLQLVREEALRDHECSRVDRCSGN